MSEREEASSDGTAMCWLLLLLSQLTFRPSFVAYRRYAERERGEYGNVSSRQCVKGVSLLPFGLNKITRRRRRTFWGNAGRLVWRRDG